MRRLEGFEKEYELLDEKAVVIDESLSKLHNYGIDYKKLEILRDLLLKEHNKFRAVGEVIKKLERIDIANIKIIHEAISRVRSKSYHARINDLIRGELRVLRNLESAFRDERVEIERAENPVLVLKAFGLGVDRSLKELREGMDDFLRALNEIGKEVEEDFEKILFSFDVAEKEFNKISGISNGLEEINKLISLKKKDIGEITELLDEIRKNLRRIGKEAEAVRKKVEEKKELAEEEKVIHRYLTYVKRLEKAYETLQKMSEESTRVIGEVENLLNRSFDEKIIQTEKTKIEELRNIIINVIGQLKSTTERYGKIFEGLRVQILCEVKRLCGELLEMVREVKEAERMGTPTRAS
ncbi:hypothetical protein [Archaeoglobus sp.]